MEFRILGPLEVIDDGRPLRLERRLSRALLAYLLLHANEPVSSDRLVDQLWGETAPRTATASLQNTISRLRKTIGAERIRHDPAGYVLRVDPESFDLARFERLVAEAKTTAPPARVELLRAALALWRGAPLEDLAFEGFGDAEAAALWERYLEAVEERIATELELGAGAGLVSELEELVLAHPLRERFRAQLMLALYRAGRQADALNAFAVARATLRDELGLDPGEGLRALQRSILEQDESLRSDRTLVARGESRRTVTVLFCDIVESTRLATRLDPEAYRALMSAYYDAVRRAVELHGGTVEKFIGDAVMALFGVPELHEDDALRAVRAAVDARDAVRRVNETAAREWDAELEVRIALNTGEVVTGTREAVATGAPVNIAAHLEKRAGRNEIVLGAETQRLVRDAVETEPAGLGHDLPVWRLRALVDASTLVARQLDAPLVGRTQELRRLRAAFQRARKDRAAVVATVIGEAGIGKTRLARAVVDSLRDDARVVVGRCVSYGAGATYLPIAEIVRAIAREPSVAGVQAVLEGEEDASHAAQRIAELVGFAEGPAAAGETFWAVRRLFESLARDRPLVVVLDDVHWAEPTLLDLVEYVGEWADAQIFVLCLARRELIESRPGWGGPTSTGFLIELEPLPAADVGALVATMAGGPLAANIADKIVEQSGGNPLFAEQLLALASEMPDRSLDEAPPTVDALIASRLDRLPQPELEVLQRASVIGRRFTAHELDLAALAAVERRGFVRGTDDGFRFHHVLVRDVAYRSLAKARRAELHESAAALLDRQDALDEIVGFHLEMAYRYRTELRRNDGHATALADAAGERLGAAGIRAWKRADTAAASNLLQRAADLLPGRAPRRRELLCELGLSLRQQGHTDTAQGILEDAARLSVEAGDRRLELRARIELAWIDLFRAPEDLPQLLDLGAKAVPELELHGDDRSLGRAWLLVGAIRGQFQCLNEAWGDAALRAAAHYRAAGFSPAWCVGNVAVSLFYGPQPVDVALRRCEEFLAENPGDPAIEANVLEATALLHALEGRFDDGRGELARSSAMWHELSQPAKANDVQFSLGTVELLAEEYESAEAVLREACADVARRGETAILASRAAELAHSLYCQAKYDEAQVWAQTARGHASAGDLHAQAAWRSVTAKLHARRGERTQAETLSVEAVALLDATDALNDRGSTLFDRAEVLLALGDERAAAATVRAARDLWVRKGNVVLAGRATARLAETSVVG